MNCVCTRTATRQDTMLCIMEKWKIPLLLCEKGGQASSFLDSHQLLTASLFFF
jgi:hypothetical protein